MEEPTSRTVPLWSKLVWRLMKQHLITMYGIARSVVRGSKKVLPTAAQNKCRHLQRYNTANQYGNYTHCKECKLRLSYVPCKRESKVKKEQIKVEAETESLQPEAETESPQLGEASQSSAAVQEVQSLRGDMQTLHQMFQSFVQEQTQIQQGISNHMMQVSQENVILRGAVEQMSGWTTMEADDGVFPDSDFVPDGVEHYHLNSLQQHHQDGS